MRLKIHNAIRAVLFDLDGTLRHNLPSGGEVFTLHAIELGLSITDEDKQRAARWEHKYFATSAELVADRERFREDQDAFWINFGRRRLGALGCPPEAANDLGEPLAIHMKDHYQPLTVVPDDAHILLSSLRKSTFILGVVSNREKSYAEELDKLGLGFYFDFSLAGGEVFAYKPAPEIFRRALERTGTNPEETLYVGDNYYADVLGARSAGLLPVLYDPVGLFKGFDCDVVTSFGELGDLME